MRSPALAASAALAIVRRDVQMFVSYRYRLVATILNTIFGLTLFYYLSRLVRVTPFHKADSYFAYAVVGLVILQVLNATIGGSPGSLRGESVAGTFER
ncbi:MAG: type transport system permease protein, partial [Solirubrobacteraceae bacterium]|nr:type transport system permease protein [Solirubrobacteraceae bacterium]